MFFILDPTSRWNATRDSPELRPYNSLPRGQDISNFPSLVAHQTKTQKERSPSPLRRVPAKRSLSEDVYSERTNENVTEATPNGTSTKSTDETKQQSRPVRENPLIKYASEHKAQNTPKKSDAKRKLQHSKTVGSEPTSKLNAAVEKHVSFENNNDVKESPVRAKLKKRELKQTHSLNERQTRTNSMSDDNGNITSGEEGGQISSEVHFAKEEAVPVELCDIEPLSGTVFRKVTVRRRRQDMRKIPAVDTGKITLY